MEFSDDRHCLPEKIQRRRNRTNFGKEDGFKMAPVAESIASIVPDSQFWEFKFSFSTRPVRSILF